MNGIQKVVGSIPIVSTRILKDPSPVGEGSFFCCHSILSPQCGQYLLSTFPRKRPQLGHLPKRIQINAPAKTNAIPRYPSQRTFVTEQMTNRIAMIRQESSSRFFAVFSFIRISPFLSAVFFSCYHQYSKRKSFFNTTLPISADLLLFSDKQGLCTQSTQPLFAIRGVLSADWSKPAPTASYPWLIGRFFSY